MGWVRVLRAFLPGLEAAGHAVAAVMASNPAGFAPAGLSAYAVSKAAVERLVECVSQEVAPDVAVVSVYPGLVATDMLRESLGDGADAYPTPERWGERAAPFLLELGPADSGRHVSIPTG